jgi:hypothetical protein
MIFLEEEELREIEPLLKGNLCCSVTLSLQNQHPVQCFTVIFEAFWKCVTEFENSPMMEWGIQLAHFCCSKKDTHGIEPLLIFAPYLLTLYISLSLKWANLSCSGAGRFYKQRM